MQFILTCCDDSKLDTYRFDAVSFEALNTDIIGTNTKRGEININSLRKSSRDLVNRLGITRIFYNSSRSITYTIFTSGIATSGTCESVVFSKDGEGPLVVSIMTSRSNGDKRIAIYQQVSENWYFESIVN